MKKKAILLCVIMIIGVIYTQCNQKKNKLEIANSNKINSKILRGPYLGQKLPGKKAELFAPKMISPLKKRHSKISVSPDGNSFYWSYYVDLKIKLRKIAFHYRNNGNWGPESIAEFQSKYGSDSPCFWGNDKIIFHAKRKITEDSTDLIDDFWLVEKKHDRWGDAKPLGLYRFGKIHKMPMLTVADNGNIYFNGKFEKGAYKLGIYVSYYKNNQYTQPVLLPEQINSKYLDWCPFIARDESYLIFASSRHGKKDWGSDLYISFKEKKGRWLEPVNMGDQINTKREERFSSVTADGEIMIFMRGINEKAEYFWIDAKIIEELKPKNSEKIQASKKYRINMKLAKEAIQKKNYETSLIYLNKSLKMAPNHPIINYQIARVNAFMGNNKQAIGFLKKAVCIGYGLKFPGEKWDVQNDTAFKWIKNRDGFKSILKNVLENEKPVHNMSPAFKIEEKDLVPEGMAYDPAGDKFYFGSLKKNKIIRTDRDGNKEDFTGEAQDGLGMVVGMEVEIKNRVLWVCSNFNRPSDRKLKNPQKWVGVFKYNITTKQLIKKYIINIEKNEKKLFNDLVISKNGDVYITESRSGAIYIIPGKTDKLELFMKPDEFASPNGITLSTDEKTIYMADWLVGIYAIDIKSKRFFLLPAGDRITTYGIDGLYYYENSLIAVQNGMDRISRFFLNKTGDKIMKLKILEGNNPVLDVPTTGAIVKNEFYFFANTPLNYFKPDGSLEMEKVKDLIVMKIKL